MIWIDIFSGVFAIVIFILAYVVFGTAVILRLKITTTPLATVVLGTLTSISIITALVALVGNWLGTTAYAVVSIAAVMGILELPTVKQTCIGVVQVCWLNKRLVAGAIFSVLMLSSTIMLSGLQRGNQVVFQEVHDSSWHLALIDQLTQNIPPAHPSLPTEMLSNYHYFYDVLLAGLVFLSGAPVQPLYFQVFPLVLSSLLVSSVALLGKQLGGRIGSFGLVYLTVFAGSFAYLIPLFFSGQAWHESSFWVSQTFVMMVNPQVVYTLAVMAIVVWLLSRQSQLALREELLIMLLIATSIGFKSYAWVILVVVYASYCLWNLMVERKKNAVLYGVAMAGLSLPFVWLITGFRSNTFSYTPLWFVDSMISSPDRLNYIKWLWVAEQYRDQRNWLGLLLLRTIQVLVFYIGNLGIRVIALMAPILYVWQGAPMATRRLITLSFVGFWFSSLFPLLFIQTGVVWNSIQFWYYALLFANVLSVWVLVWIWRHTSRVVSMTLVVILLLLSLPTTLKTLQDKMVLHQVPASLVHRLQAFMPDERILLCPTGNMYYQTLIVQVYTPATIYLSAPLQLEVVGSDRAVADELEAAFDQRDHDILREILSDNSIQVVACEDTTRSEFIGEVTSTEPDVVGNWLFFPVQ